MLQFIAVVIIAVLVAVDQGIKYLAVLHLEPIGSFPLLDGILQFVRIYGDCFALRLCVFTVRKKQACSCVYCGNSDFIGRRGQFN